MYRHLILLVSVVALAACSASSSEDVARVHHHPDASVPPPACDPTHAGCVACYEVADPQQACSTPQMCCFSQYDSSANGTCQSTATYCPFGNEHCDGTEDCAVGWKCWADERAVGDMFQWDISCAPSQPQGLAVYQMCHPNSFQCPSGTTCVPARSAGAYNLPAELYVCH